VCAGLWSGGAQRETCSDQDADAWFSVLLLVSVGWMEVSEGAVVPHSLHIIGRALIASSG
jgi:hypothetical protein